ncbi:PaaI family thioesterase [Roseateles violae]|uniref:PaaI family thioesterase n=1 Tax=Roseateles violae TaxID=3058042 RepID=A0ABT8DZ87_9BURK|nr:PaaI family thioesterase [Pelomonas sp. PFR6]MDN3922887.1 PaaI family thioesterase [Pelomonas sp. PFR6]
MSTPPLSFPVHIPFVEQLGFELLAAGGGESELSVNLTDAHMNSWAVAHGGVVMTLLDVAMAIAARSPQRSGEGYGPGVVTVEMKTSFMRPGEGRLRGLGKLLHRTATMAFCEGSVLDEQGRLCAHATGTFKFIKALPARDRALKPLQNKGEDPAQPLK